MTDSDLWFYLNGKHVRGRDASIPLGDRGIQWGDAVYDSIRTYGGTPFRMDFRIERFFQSMHYARITPPFTKDELRKASADLLKANEPMIGPNEDISINYYVSRGAMSLTDGLTPPGTAAIIPRKINFAGFAKHYVTGAPGITPSTRRTPPQSVSPKAKISNKMNHFVAEMEAKAHNPEAYAIMLDLEGNIAESSGANFLFVSDGRIKVPNLRYVLSGADQDSLFDLASNMQIGCDEGTFTAFDLYNAQEAFVTANSIGIVPIISVNGLPLGSGGVGPVTRRLMDGWKELVGIDFVEQGLSHLPPEERANLTEQWNNMGA